MPYSCECCERDDLDDDDVYGYIRAEIAVELDEGDVAWQSIRNGEIEHTELIAIYHEECGDEVIWFAEPEPQEQPQQDAEAPPEVRVRVPSAACTAHRGPRF